MAQTRTSTPLRYPGGKSQLYEFVVNTLEKNNISGTYIEPFAGGAGIAFELLLNDNVERVVINDLDPSIHAVWFNILHNSDKLIELIKDVPFDYTAPGKCSSDKLIKFWDDIKSEHKKVSEKSKSLRNAFTTLMLNRMNRSGIINGGPIGGRKQTGKYQLDARFNKKTLIKKIKAIAERASNIDLYNLDANQLIDVIKKSKVYDFDNTFIFFDPPYFVQGKNLYLSFIEEKQHSLLAENILSMNDYFWITTYDYVEQISDLYQEASQRYAYNLNYTANKRGKFHEYLFASERTKLQFTEQMNVSQI